ncbi:MAG TPA: hypothetical protein VNM90_13950 [Haliangium sp.]|nr:hypothetical protein [Haliangium sp.]
MRAIPTSRSTLTFWEDLIFLEAALLADEETRELAAPVTALINEFMPALQRDLETRRSLIQSSARTSVADARLDFGIRGLFSDTLHLVKQNRKRPEFTALFSTHIGAVVRHALKRQVEVARDLLDKLGLPHYPEEFRSAQIHALQPLIARGAQVLEEQRQAELARVGGRIDVRTWKEEANAVRLSVYASLLALAAKNGRGKPWAEVFFKQKSAAGESEDDGDAPVDGGEPPDEV